MARIEWVHQRLENWALWRARGGFGYAKQSIFADGPAARGQVAEAVIPVDDLEASDTNDAVEALKLGHGHLYQTLHLYYVRGQGIKGTARSMRRAESTIHSQLGSADQLLAAWFSDRTARKRVQWRADASRIPLAPVMSLSGMSVPPPPKVPRPVKPQRSKPAPAPELEGPPRPRRARPILTLKRKDTA